VCCLWLSSVVQDLEKLQNAGGVKKVTEHRHHILKGVDIVNLHYERPKANKTMAEDVMQDPNKEKDIDDTDVSLQDILVVTHPCKML
jgi:hypothetical protein